MPDTTSTRDRLVDVAAALFARKGYSSTSVADIQIACGLTGGSGALYKHFGSKRELLDEIVERHLATLAQGHAGAAATLPEDPRAALRMLVEQVWAAMARDRDLLRVLLRDLDPFPELLERTWRGVQDHLYGVLTEWLGGRVADPAASAAVLVGSLTYYRILDVLIGRVPGDVEEARYDEAWVQHAVALLDRSAAQEPS